MAYQEALEAAGATVHAFQSFGSYQGDWWARVTFNGQTGWIRGSYGSCSGCDAFEAEFGIDDGHCDEHWSGKGSEGCDECKRLSACYATKLSSFGAGYLDGLVSQAEAEAEAEKNIEWDSDAQPMLDYIRANKE